MWLPSPKRLRSTDPASPIGHCSYLGLAPARLLLLLLAPPLQPLHVRGVRHGTALFPLLRRPLAASISACLPRSLLLSWGCLLPPLLLLLLAACGLPCFLPCFLLVLPSAGRLHNLLL